MALGVGSLRTSLRSRRETKTVGKVEGKEYDYIIVGGGAAGCVLANRLSADASKDVLLLEAGEASPNHPLVKVPVAILKLFKSKWDWNFESAPSKSTGERSLYLCRGKALGGSSCTNVMLYTRGSPADFDNWAKECGDDTWASPAMLDYFKKAEKCVSAEVTNKEYHGYEGLHAVSDVPYQNEMSKAFLTAAAEEAKWGANNDFNDWSRPQTGFGRYQVAQNKGVRVTAASAYLNREVRARPNLEIVVGANAKKVLFDGDRAVGVELGFGDKEAKATAKVGGEIISCSGAIGSPQLLLLSGVGPCDELKKHGIDSVRDLAGVGRGLQDHPATLVSYEGSPKTKGMSHSSKLRLPGTTVTSPVAALQWLFKGKGPLTSPGCDHGGFLPVEKTGSKADMQFRFLATKTITPDGMSTIAEGYSAVKDHPDGFTIQTIVARPKSKEGKVQLRSASPTEKPLISDVHLTDDRDVACLVDAIKLGREIAMQPALDGYRGDEEFPGAAVTTDEALGEYVRSTVHSANALVGTCKLGKPGDKTAVVDNHLRVMGLHGLRVADSSVMPTLPGGQTCSSTIAIAEKAADLILSAAAAAPASSPA